MPFAKPTLLVETVDGHNFTLMEDLVYVSEGGITYTAPKGSQTDGASTPPVLWPTIPPFGKYWLAAVLHDWAYRYSDLTKQECDWLIKEAMKSLDVDALLADTIYEGVNVGGWSSFEQDRASRPPFKPILSPP
jgi:Protein of unknown function (DUF1353)